MKIKTVSVFEYDCQETVTFAALTTEGLLARLSEDYPEEKFESEEHFHKYLDNLNEETGLSNIATFETVEVKMH